MNLHFHYDQLTEKERHFVDEEFRFLYTNARLEGIPLRGDDDAERAVDAVANLIIASRPVFTEQENT